MPIWYWEGHLLPNPVWAYIGATATDIYVCLANVDFNTTFTSLYLDVNNTGATLADEHAYSLRISNDGTSQSNAGDGFGGYTGTNLARLGFGLSTNPRFYAWVGYRVSRSEITSSDGRFRMMFVHHWIGGTSGNDYGWPVNGIWNSPASWPVFRVNDGSVPPADNQNPTVTVLHSPSPNVPAGHSLTIRADALDDTDVPRWTSWWMGRCNAHALTRRCRYQRATASTTYTPAVGGHSTMRT